LRRGEYFSRGGKTATKRNKRAQLGESMADGGEKVRLKMLHEEIDLFDRKLAHLMKYDVFPSETERNAAARKLSLKREALVSKAKALTDEGTEFKPNDLPRSFRPKDVRVEAEPEEIVEAKTVAVSPNGEKRSVRRSSSAFAGTGFDWQQSVKEYMAKKVKE
jgi:hypothetical protein